MCYVLGTRGNELVCERWSLGTGEMLDRTVLLHARYIVQSSFRAADPDQVWMLVRTDQWQRLARLDLLTMSLAWWLDLRFHCALWSLSRDGRVCAAHGWRGDHDGLSIVVEGRWAFEVRLVRASTLSPDGRWFVRFDRVREPDTEPGLIEVYDTATGVSVVKFDIKPACWLHELELADDRATLWGLGIDRLWAWDVNTGAELGQWPLGEVGGNEVIVAVARDGRAAFLGDGRAFAVGDGGEVDPAAFAWSARAEQMAPDGRGLLMCGATLRWLDLVTGRCDAFHAEGHIGQVRALATTDDGATLATAGDDPAVHVRDAVTGALRWSLESSVRKYALLAFAPDGRTLYGAREWPSFKVVAWDLATGGEIPPRLPGSRDLLQTLEDWDRLSPRDPAPDARPERPLDEDAWRREPRHVTWSFDRKYMVGVNHTDWWAAALVYRYDGGFELVQRVELGLFYSEICVAMGHRLCAFGTCWGDVALLDSTTGVLTLAPERAYAKVTVLLFSPDESRLYVGTADGRVRVYQT